jgi:nucleotide-binding universal stress UspA family protein
LLLLRVVAPDFTWTHPATPPTAESGAATRQATARDYLRRLATPLEAEGIRTRVEVSIGGAAEVIAATLLRHDAALVVLTTHGQTGIAQMPLGSVAKTVFWCGYVPTLLNRPPAMLPAVRGARARGNTPFGDLPRGTANGC